MYSKRENVKTTFSIKGNKKEGGPRGMTPSVIKILGHMVLPCDFLKLSY